MGLLRVGSAFTLLYYVRNGRFLTMMFADLFNEREKARVTAPAEPRQRGQHQSPRRENGRDGDRRGGGGYGPPRRGQEVRKGKGSRKPY